MVSLRAERPGLEDVARPDRRSLWRCLGAVGLLHLAGWGLLVGVVAPRQFEVGGGLLGIGLGLTAYTLGMRHAFDADHIAAIDNTTRKLMSDGQRPMSVGFWFSLGHSSVVFLVVMGITLGVRTLASGVQDGDSTLQQVARVWGPTVSGAFLLLIGLINLLALLGIMRVFRATLRGHFDEAELERRLASRGLLNRVLGRVNEAVRKPWHMFPVGFLFGLGFDTVTEVALLVMAGGAVAGDLPWWAVIPLPVLFAAGMSLLDTLDGAFMNVAYGWAFARPVRKLYYNLTVTALSVAVALAIGVVTLGSMFGEVAGAQHGLLAWFARMNLEYVGLGIVLLFVFAWAGSLAFWKLGRIEERWAHKPLD